MSTISRVCKYAISPQADMLVVKGDITKVNVDAIVNAANEGMLGGGGVDGAIHKAAGVGLLQECRQAPQVAPGVRCPTGEARITGGHALPCKHVIHTVGPVYKQVSNPAQLLTNAYRNCMILANENKLNSIAFPALSCGVFGYPYQEAAQIAVKTCVDNVGQIKHVQFVLFNDEIYDVFNSTAQDMLTKA